MSNFYASYPFEGSTWKPPVANAAALPLTNNSNGDARIDLSTDTIYVWNGTSWIAVATPGAAIAIDGLIGDVSASGPGVVPASIIATTNSTITTLSALSLPGSQVTGNISGNAANITAASNTTLTTLSALSLPYSQLTGAPTVNGFTAGSVLFAGAGGGITQDNANLFWNDTNFSLGLGTNTPVSTSFIDAVNSTGATKRIVMTGYGTGSFVGTRDRFARGTIGSPSAAQTGDNLGFISGQGYGTSQFPATSTAAINFIAGETFTNTSNATYIAFQVTPTGSITPAEATRINSTGNLLIGTTTDSGTEKLQVNGNSNVGTVTSGLWNGTVTAATSFLTSGTTYTTPSNITTATLFKFTLIGGGGGGGGFAATGSSSSGGGGGGGGIVWVTGLSPSTAYTIAIGGAGSGGIATTPGNAGSGGNTTLTIGATTYTARGGTGSSGGSTNVDGGAGGTTTNFTIGITGQNGNGADNNSPSAAGGGGCPPFGFGLGGASIGAGGVGLIGTGFGAGGGGAHGTAAAGGAGTAGCILVELQN